MGTNRSEFLRGRLLTFRRQLRRLDTETLLISRMKESMKGPSLGWFFISWGCFVSSLQRERAIDEVDSRFVLDLLGLAANSILTTTTGETK